MIQAPPLSGRRLVGGDAPSSIYSYLCFYTSFLLFRRLDLVSAAITPWVIMIQAPPLSRHRLVGGEASSLSAGSAPV
jgi:hypothetical protein